MKNRKEQLAIPSLLAIQGSARGRCLARSRERRVYFFPNRIMMKRLFDALRVLLGREHICTREQHEIDDRSRSLWRGEHGDMAAEAFQHRCDCDTPRYYVRISAHGADAGLYPLCDVTYESLQSAIILLQRALAALGEHTGPWPLHTTWLRGKGYFVDDCLGELRAIDNPTDRVFLVEPD